LYFVFEQSKKVSFTTLVKEAWIQGPNSQNDVNLEIIFGLATIS